MIPHDPAYDSLARFVGGLKFRALKWVMDRLYTPVPSALWEPILLNAVDELGPGIQGAELTPVPMMYGFPYALWNDARQHQKAVKYADGVRTGLPFVQELNGHRFLCISGAGIRLIYA